MFCKKVAMASILLYILLQIIMVFRTKNSCRVFMTSTTQLWLIYWSEHTSALTTHRRFPSIYHISNLWVTSIWRLSTTSSQAATLRSSLQHFIVSCLRPLWYDKASRWMFNTQAICQVTKRPISNNINQETWESMHLLVYFLLLLSVLSKKCFYRASIIQKRIFCVETERRYAFILSFEALSVIMNSGTIKTNIRLQNWFQTNSASHEFDVT